MTVQDVTFGFVTQPTPKGFPEDIMEDPTKSAQALIDANESFIEALPPQFDTIWVEDHFQWDKRPVIEAMTTLTYLAARHQDKRFGSIVLGQSYRNPALTAKMAANIQMMTHGRFILGIGAGWKEDEYRAYGYPYPPAGQRIAELEDAVNIIREMWSESPATFHGEYYSIENAYCEPQPNPPIPLLIAGGGEQKTLRVVARYADWWNFNFCTSEEYAHKQQVLHERCREIGRNPDDILQSYYGALSIVRDPSHVETRDFHVVGGTPDQVRNELQKFVDLGIRHIQMRFIDFPSQDGLKLFTEEVLPGLK